MMDWQEWVVWAIGGIVGWLVFRAVVHRLWPLMKGRQAPLCDACTNKCEQCTKIKEVGLVEFDKE